MPAIALPPRRAQFLARRRRNYYLFIAPALIVVIGVIVFPWLFTLWMSAFDWKIGSDAHFVGFGNYAQALNGPPAQRTTPTSAAQTP